VFAAFVGVSLGLLIDILKRGAGESGMFELSAQSML
jgi:hypothetical protein